MLFLHVVDFNAVSKITRFVVLELALGTISPSNPKSLEKNEAGAAYEGLGQKRKAAN
jgi:hypothetical protein